MHEASAFNRWKPKTRLDIKNIIKNLCRMHEHKKNVESSVSLESVLCSFFGGAFAFPLAYPVRYKCFKTAVIFNKHILRDVRATLCAHVTHFSAFRERHLNVTLTGACNLTCKFGCGAWSLWSEHEKESQASADDPHSKHENYCKKLFMQPAN